ncbi:hypothetical protein ALC57_17857 [Trachymyrmex cornetzi]|uniref:SAP domain-containing protein n=1 Tax=Trachymyrmex cornetzi TaxID=471704 RepID=A0A151IT81_9HYME|nr:hypothetical protein ALC57_17857 [Trachymyrmex cornetzi]
MSDPNKFTITALKELLIAHGLSGADTKTELIARLIEADPSGTWPNSEQNEGNDDTESTRQADARDTQPTTSRQQREADLCRREKELAERELVIVRLKLEATRKMLQIERVTEDNRHATTTIDMQRRGVD